MLLTHCPLEPPSEAPIVIGTSRLCSPASANLTSHHLSSPFALFSPGSHSQRPTYFHFATISDASIVLTLSATPLESSSRPNRPSSSRHAFLVTGSTTTTRRSKRSPRICATRLIGRAPIFLEDYLLGLCISRDHERSSSSRPAEWCSKGERREPPARHAPQPPQAKELDIRTETHSQTKPTCRRPEAPAAAEEEVA